MVGFAPELDPVGRRRILDDLLSAALDDIRRGKWRQVLQPEAGCLGFAVTEHPRLDDLIRLAVDTGHDTDRVFDGDPFSTAHHELHEEADGGEALKITRLAGDTVGLGVPAVAGDREIGAGRMRDQQIPEAFDLMGRPVACLERNTPPRLWEGSFP